MLGLDFFSRSTLFVYVKYIRFMGRFIYSSLTYALSWEFMYISCFLLVESVYAGARFLLSLYPFLISHVFPAIRSTKCVRLRVRSAEVSIGWRGSGSDCPTLQSDILRPVVSARGWHHSLAGNDAPPSPSSVNICRNLATESGLPPGPSLLILLTQDPRLDSQNVVPNPDRTGG